MFERIHIIIFLMIFVSCKTNSQQGNINKKTLYSDLDHEHSIPTEKFFQQRREKLCRYFKAILSAERYDAKEIEY